MRHLIGTKSSVSRYFFVSDLLSGTRTKGLTNHCSPDLLESQLYVNYTKQVLVFESDVI